MVDTHSRKAYKGMKAFLSTDGLMGVAITKDGDIVSVFSRSKSRNAVNKLIAFAVANGGRKLDAYGGGLQNMYARLGGKMHARVKFDEQYAPKGWDKKSRYDVVAMSMPKSLDALVKSYRDGGKAHIENVPYAADYGEMIEKRDREMSNPRSGIGLSDGRRPTKPNGKEFISS